MSDDRTVFKMANESIKCKTVYGAEYVKKVTHPPADARFEGTPSKASPNVSIFEIAAESNVPVTFQYNSGNIQTPVIQTINATAVLFLTPSGGKVGSYVFYKVGQGNWVQQSALNFPIGTSPAGMAAVTNDAYDWANQYYTDFACTRQAYKSTTFYLNATKNNNQGTVTTAKFKPDILTGYTGLGLTGYSKSAGHTATHNLTIDDLIQHYQDQGPSHKATVSSLRKIKGEHLNQHKSSNSPIDDDGYEVLSNQNIKAPTTNFRIQVLNFGTVPGTVGTLGGNITIQNVLPADATTLLNYSRKSASRIAEEGAFVVQADSDDVNLFISTPADDTTQPNNQLPATLMMFYNAQTNNTQFIRLLSGPASSGVDINNYSDIPWNMSDWSFTLFDGLSTSNSEAWGLPYITVKTITGWEAQPRQKTFAALTQRLLPLPDAEALEMAAGIHLQRPDSLPASANDLGTIASTVLKFLPSAVGWLKDLFGSKNKQETAVTQAKEFIKPAVRQRSKTNINQIANAVASKINISQAPRLPSVKGNANPAEQYRKPSRQRGSSVRSKSSQRSGSKNRSNKSNKQVRVIGLSNSARSRQSLMN